MQEVKKIRKSDSNKKQEKKLSDLDTRKSEMNKEIKSVNYNDLEDLVYRTELTYDEIIEILDINFYPSQREVYTLPPGIHEISNFIKTLHHFLPDIVKKSITINENRLRSDLNNNQTLLFSEKCFFLYNVRIHSMSFRTLR